MISSRKPVIVLFPEASFGAALNCVGIAQQLQQRGAKPVFLTHPGFSGIFNEYGFIEYPIPVDSEASAEETKSYWQSFLSRHLPHFKLSPEDQIETYVSQVWAAIVASAKEVEKGLAELLKKINPELILLDNVIMFPAIQRFGCPWVRVISCAETELGDPNIPPYLSGIASDNRKAFEPFRQHYLKSLDSIHADYNHFRETRGLLTLPAGEFLESSPYLNLCLAPEIVRRPRKKLLAENIYKFLEGCVRQEGPFEVPVLPRNEGALVYVSFGSLGAADTDLLQRMICVFAQFPARFLLNVGGLIDAYSEVPDNVYLEEWYPQPTVVQQCDLFIHHGGNNSFCEALYFGVPSLILPYCWDGHDNAARAEECRVGKRLNRNNWTDKELSNAIRELLGDKEMKSRLKENGVYMQQNCGRVLAVDSIMSLLE